MYKVVHTIKENYIAKPYKSDYQQEIIKITIVKYIIIILKTFITTYLKNVFPVLYTHEVCQTKTYVLFFTLRKNVDSSRVAKGF